MNLLKATNPSKFDMYLNQVFLFEVQYCDKNTYVCIFKFKDSIF